MTKKTTTKKSGTIAYQLRRQNDLTGTATEKNPQMAVTVVNSKLTTTKELAEYINFACSVTESDIAAVLQALAPHTGTGTWEGRIAMCENVCDNILAWQQQDINKMNIVL